MVFTVPAPQDLLGARRCQKRKNTTAYWFFMKTCGIHYGKDQNCLKCEMRVNPHRKTYALANGFHYQFKSTPAFSRVPRKSAFWGWISWKSHKICGIPPFSWKIWFRRPRGPDSYKTLLFLMILGALFRKSALLGWKADFGVEKCSFSGNGGFSAKSRHFAEKLILGGKVDLDNLFKAEKVTLSTNGKLAGPEGAEITNIDGISPIFMKFHSI